MDAALKVMRTNGFQGASVQDILEEAGLSTRAFYRQFRSKDDLLLAMFRTASGRDVSAVEKRVAAAATVTEAVDAWLDEMLAIAFDRRRLSRLVMFNVTARKTEGFDDEVAFMRRALVAPLLRALEAGAADGSCPGADPVPDAHALFDLVWSRAGPQARAERPIDRAAAKAHVRRFAWPALGWAG
jgi:AcrR family transcriptional regulator